MDKLAHPGHPLDEHLRSVARLAGEFGVVTGTRDWANLAGLWHDLGKYRPAFQQRIHAADGSDAHLEALPGKKVRHAIVGALHAQSLGAYGKLLGYLIAGHHAGLPDWFANGNGAALSQELREQSDALADALAGGIPEAILNGPNAGLSKPPVADARELHLWLRMLFSCLVDADFLDTEAALDKGRTALRGGYANVSDLCVAYDRYMATTFAKADGHVKARREEIRAACLGHAADAPGLFSLTVPTGGGKTLASLGFALHHAARHALKRVIYVIPYTSIIEQTADVFRKVFARIEPSPVIEHHSNLDVADETRETAKSRLAAENWDAPIIVTTNVQFFESLYAARGSRCRKLHNIAESVVILDEAQLLPPEHLAPILDALRQLKERYRVSIVLSTATQPELTKKREHFGQKTLVGLGDAIELAPDPEDLYRKLNRVTVSLPASDQDRRTWDEMADAVANEAQALCIVNRRDDAETLWRKLRARGVDGLVHLSARMCGAHRALVIARVKAELIAGRPLRVVSTQLVEAGVDFDFPVVYRAMAGLDSIAQAAGRCNREGKLPEKGRVVVFNPPKPSPDGILRKAEDAAKVVLHGSSGEPLAPANYAPYFDRFYWSMNTHDKEGVMDLLTDGAAKAQIQFRTAAAKFRLIPDQGQRSVFVRWGEGAALIERLAVEGPHRTLMRQLQRYAVTLYDYQWKKLLASGDLKEHESLDCLIQTTDVLYHPELGLLPEAPDYAPMSLTDWKEDA
jgi:CRISPR-associated endonuclease/helicase Cas3